MGGRCTRNVQHEAGAGTSGALRLACWTAVYTGYCTREAGRLEPWRRLSEMHDAALEYREDRNRLMTRLLQLLAQWPDQPHMPQ